jgi:hypothetical protein
MPAFYRKSLGLTVCARFTPRANHLRNPWAIIAVVCVVMGLAQSHVLHVHPWEPELCSCPLIEFQKQPAPA